MSQKHSSSFEFEFLKSNVNFKCLVCNGCFWYNYFCWLIIRPKIKLKCSAAIAVFLFCFVFKKCL